MRQFLALHSVMEEEDNLEVGEEALGRCSKSFVCTSAF